MMDCRDMATPMALNLKLLSNVSCHDVLLDDWLIDVSNEYETRHMLCYEHLEPIPNRSETCSPDRCKECIEVPKGYSGLWA